MNRMLVLAASAAMWMPVGSADARDRYETRQIAVPAAGLDLSTDAGIDILAARIDKGIDRICGWDGDCRDGAWESTEWQVDRLIRKARAWRRLAEERAAQLRACRDRCTRPAAWYAPPPPPSATTVIVIRD
ncbi:UrcA family protein [Sphingomonas sp. ST-64]|uniref:UrcA family protein n=1 Tax=Sphingomonas plantiphila TaxID=3163295 RepID=A0ABW8YNM4_9SPHN